MYVISNFIRIYRWYMKFWRIWMKLSFNFLANLISNRSIIFPEHVHLQRGSKTDEVIRWTLVKLHYFEWFFVSFSVDFFRDFLSCLVFSSDFLNFFLLLMFLIFYVIRKHHQSLANTPFIPKKTTTYTYGNWLSRCTANS